MGGDPVLLLERSSAAACAVVAINYTSQDQAVAAATSCPGATFDVVLGGSGSVTADGAGALSATMPARSAVVYRAGP